MKPELQQKLFSKYPKIFKQKDLPMTESAMCWGIECGDGWYWLIDNLCSVIQAHCNSKSDAAIVSNESKKCWFKYWRNYTSWSEGVWFRLKKLWQYYKQSRAIEEELQIEALQVKEKYGGLRFYISGGNDNVFGMISFAEHLSYRICEECGSLKNVKQSSGWIKTLCSKCMKKLNKTPAIIEAE